MNRVRFDRKWFNPLYFILLDLLKQDSIRTIFVYGGKSSAKTISITQALVRSALIDNASSIAFRKESVIIPTTLKKSFNLSINSMRVSPVFETQDRRYACDNGSEIILKGLDDPEKAKGVESYKYVYVDELNQFEQTEWEQMNLSLRGIQGQKMIGSWNPVNDQVWIKTDIIDQIEWHETEYKMPCESSSVKMSADGRTVLIKTTYEDNYWIVGSPCGTYGYRDENLIREYTDLRSRNYNSYKVNVLGEWGKVVFGGEFLKCWKSEQHVGVHKHNPKLAVYLSFDENVNPYFPCGIFQISEDEKHIYLIHAIAAKHPNNTVKWMGREVTRKLKEWGHTERLYVTGDPTSQKEDVKQEKGHDFFRLIIGELAEFNPIRFTLTGSPSVRMSADFFNSILESNIYDLHFHADESCRIAILDFENTKEDKNGKVDKKTVTDPVTKVSYQPWGHFVDLTRYLLVRLLADEYTKYQRNGIISTPTVGKHHSKGTY